MTRSIAPTSALGSFFRNLPDTLQQPAAIAMMGSIGAHLLFFATLPAFTPAESENLDRELRRVQVIDLPQNETQQPSSPASPALRSPLGLPPVPNLQNPQVQPGQSQPGQSSSVLIPPNPLYTIPDLNTPIDSTPQREFSRILEELNRQQSRTVITPRTQNPRPRPQPTTQPTQAPQPTPPANTSPGGMKPFDPNELARTEPPTDFNPPNQPQPTETPATTPPTPPVVARNDQLLAATRYNPEGTNFREVQTTLLGNWFKGLSEKGITEEPELVNVRRLQDPKLEKPIPELPYPLSFALNHFKQHPAVVIVLVGKDGKPIGRPEILGSTGYPILNEAAIREVEKTKSYEPSERVRAYLYEFQFKPPATPNTASAPQTPMGN